MEDFKSRLRELEQKTQSLSGKVIFYQRSSYFLAITLMALLGMGIGDSSKSHMEEIKSLKATVNTLVTKNKIIEKKVRHIDADSRDGLKINSNLQINEGGLRIRESIKENNKKKVGMLEIRAMDGLGDKKQGLFHHTYQNKTTSIRTTKPIHNVNY